MLDLDDDTFDALVEQEFSALPEAMLRHLDNVAIFVEDIDPDAGMDLLGVYEGVDSPSRGDYGFGEMPDRIVLFKLPLLAACRDLQELRHQIHVTLVHEIAHFYGLDDDELHRLGWG
ncbi:MAG: metallopeptidase family protein [Actinomycetaceae bacterium]|nr:metallopeptidase family protein [Actinomycetaceae bacterium]